MNKTVTWSGVELNAAQLFRELFNNAPIRDPDWMIREFMGPCTLEEAQSWLFENNGGSGKGVFDLGTVYGRPINVRANHKDVIVEDSAVLYDANAGNGAFLRIIERLKAENEL